MARKRRGGFGSTTAEHTERFHKALQSAMTILHDELPHTMTCRQAVNALMKAGNRLEDAWTHIDSVPQGERDPLYREYDLPRELWDRTKESVLGQCLRLPSGRKGRLA